MEAWTRGTQENTVTHDYRRFQNNIVPTSAITQKHHEPLEGCEGQNRSQDINQQVTGDATDAVLALLFQQNPAPIEVQRVGKEVL